MNQNSRIIHMDSVRDEVVTRLYGKSMQRGGEPYGSWRATSLIASAVSITISCSKSLRGTSTMTACYVWSGACSTRGTWRIGSGTEPKVGRRRAALSVRFCRTSTSTSWIGSSKTRWSQRTRRAKVWEQRSRQLPSHDPFDPAYRRLRYVRYADDFLLGFTGPKSETEEIRQKLADYLANDLRLTLSPQKTLITHAASERARFLGYEIGIVRNDALLSKYRKEGKARWKRRATNGHPLLVMPQDVVRNIWRRFSRQGEVLHEAKRICDDDYTIIRGYQSVLRGLYNYYCMAPNVSGRMAAVKWVLGQSLVKTLAAKHKSTVCDILKRYKTTTETDGRCYTVLRVVKERPGKKPLVAEFGGFPLARIPHGLGRVDFDFNAAWFNPVTSRSEAVACLLAGECALCGAIGPVQMHHLRKLADLKRYPNAKWAKTMSARRRKFLPVCVACHGRIHRGDYDGPALSCLQESLMLEN